MNLLRNITLIIFFLFNLILSAQTKSSIKQIAQIEKEAEFISTDRLGNLYIAKENFLWMYNKNGDSLYAFNSKRYGEISSIDCSDPYKILVFFRNYGIIHFLDNYLSENGDPIDLQELGFDQITQACLSRENGFWVFDQMRQRVYHLNDNFKVTHESVNFMQWFGKRLNPSFMIEYNNQLFVNVPEEGILVFDHFGTYIKTIPLKNLKEPQVLDGNINFVADNQFCQYQRQEMERVCSPIDFNKLTQARIEKGRLYTFDGKKCTIFKTN